MQTITLDALIPREDLNILSTTGSSGNTRNKTTLSIEDLKYDANCDIRHLFEWTPYVV